MKGANLESIQGRTMSLLHPYEIYKTVKKIMGYIQLNKKELRKLQMYKSLDRTSETLLLLLLIKVYLKIIKITIKS